MTVYELFFNQDISTSEDVEPPGIDYANKKIEFRCAIGVYNPADSTQGYQLAFKDSNFVDVPGLTPAFKNVGSKTTAILKVQLATMTDPNDDWSPPAYLIVTKVDPVLGPVEVLRFAINNIPVVAAISIE